MKIISHRGFWKQQNEKNTALAFSRSFDLGLGTETDLRDRNGRIAIAHDVSDKGEFFLEDLLDLMNGRNLPLALNIKADGQAQLIKKILMQYNHQNYFTFDMSIPDMLSHINMELNVYTGLSDILPSPVMIEKSKGIWLDSFFSDWFSTSLIDELLSNGSSVCVVSADLHKRDNKKQWQILSKVKNHTNNNFMLCTDNPLEALDYFGVKE